MAVNTGGMCTTTITGTGIEAGNAARTEANASGPPVEAPITTRSTPPGRMERTGGDAGAVLRGVVAAGADTTGWWTGRATAGGRWETGGA